ncbi:MAG: Uncharacterized protein G01um101416_124 [Microgenomates group bacterium Gr01-1014_16]|nr:MAG: Uncharacterized protein G01um101416_124 [Microgenomates group bacterium Gr01-1014_16]
MKKGLPAGRRAGIHNPYWDSLGGGERYTASFVKLLLDEGWQVDITWPKNISSQILDRFGIDISLANYVPQLTTHNYQLIFWLSDGSLPTSFARNTIVHFQMPFKDIGGRSTLNFIKSRFYKFVSNSEFTKKTVDKEFNINSSVIYPPIDTSKFTAGKKENLIFYIGRFSNLTQRKGHDQLIKSFKKLKLKGWKLILAGGMGVGSTEKDIQHLKKLSDGSNIEFVINPSFSQIQNLCAIGKIFWSASGYSADKAIQTEHFGITVVEAMSAGAVPIITNLGGHKEIVDDKTNGYLWNSPEELEKITIELTTDNLPAGRQGQQLTTISSAAITKSKIFDISEFNRRFLMLI